jgi:hypothetical protein
MVTSDFVFGSQLYVGTETTKRGAVLNSVPETVPDTPSPPFRWGQHEYTLTSPTPLHHRGRPLARETPEGRAETALEGPVEEVGIVAEVLDRGVRVPGVATVLAGQDLPASGQAVECPPGDAASDAVDRVHGVEVVVRAEHRPRGPYGRLWKAVAEAQSAAVVRAHHYWSSAFERSWEAARDYAVRSDRSLLLPRELGPEQVQVWVGMSLQLERASTEAEQASLARVRDQLTAERERLDQLLTSGLIGPEAAQKRWEAAQHDAHAERRMLTAHDEDDADDAEDLESREG